MTHPRERKPTPAELGLTVTVGIVALSQSEGCFVAVTDQMLSYSDVFQAVDQGAKKTLKIAEDWHMNFAATDVTVVPRIFFAIRSSLRPLSDVRLTTEQVQRAVETAYKEVFHAHFVETHLARFGYSSMDEFRREGRKDLDDDFSDYLTKLAKYDLGVELTIFGFNDSGRPRLFEVVNPGRIVHIAVQGFSVVGTGYNMAVHSLRRKPLPHSSDELIYRALEAKFSAETATGVGPSTTAVVVTKDAAYQMPDEDIEAIKQVWKATLTEPTPSAALEVIGKFQRTAQPGA